MNPASQPAARGGKKPKLDPAKLYSGDNGRITCGELRCAGYSAHFTGKTIYGKRVRAVSDADAAYWLAEIGEPIACELCGKQVAR